MGACGPTRAAQTWSVSLETLMEDLAVTLGLALCVPQHPWAQQQGGRPVPMPSSVPVVVVCEAQQASEPQQCGK